MPAPIYPSSRASATAADRIPVDHLGLQARGRRFLDQLLVATLHTAVALAEVYHVTESVGEDLDLHVAGVLHVSLQIDGAVAESGQRLLPRDLEAPLQVSDVTHYRSCRGHPRPLTP